MSVPKKVGDIGPASGSLPLKRTDDAYTFKIQEQILKRRKMVRDKPDEEPSANSSSLEKEYISGIADNFQIMESTKGDKVIWDTLRSKMMDPDDTQLGRMFEIPVPLSPPSVMMNHYEIQNRRRCGICWTNLKYSHEFLPASITCGHSFCRRCILTHLGEQQDATGTYRCPTCHRPYLTRPALVPYTSDVKNSQRDFSFKLAGQHKQHRIRTMTSPTGEDDHFLMRHKASLMRMIGLHGEGITKSGSHVNRMIKIINYNTVGGEGYIKYMDPHLMFGMQGGNFISVSDIFKPRNDVRTVITQGVAGIGKTTLAHKFITDWADGKSNENVDFVLMLPFWKLNLVKDFSCSLHKLLLNFHPEFNELADLKQLDDSEVMVILDGMYEGQFVLDFQNNQQLCDITEASSVDTLMTNIIKGNLLPFAKVWITLRPSSTKQIPSCYINVMTEILPFNDSQMEECVRECINDVTETSSILQKIKTSKHLHAMCYNPALCKIAVSVVKSMLEHGETKIIQTCTELFSHFLLSQINAETETESSSELVGDEESDRKPHSKRREVMLRFSELALRRLMNNSFTFSEKDLKDHDIDVSDTASVFGIFTEINQENHEFFQEKVFCFTQAIIQEFLAALCVFYAYSTKNMGILQHLLEGMSQFECEKVSLDILLRCVIDKVLDRMYRHQYFLRFLAGMSLESSQILLQALLTNTSSSSATTESILGHFKDLGEQADVSLETCLNLLHCRIEMQDLFVTEDINDLLRLPRDFSLSQWSEIAFLVQMTGIILYEFNFQNCHPSQRNLLLRMFLRRFLSCSRKAVLSNCSLSCRSCEVVASLLQQPHCPLRELDMSGNNLGDSGVHRLGSGLISPNCKLEILRLSNCSLSRRSCEVVASVIQQPHCPLRELDMSGNYLGDFGVHRLGSGLLVYHCKLKILRLSNCTLSKDSCEVVASVLQQPHCPLRELDMSGNDLRNSGIEKLCSGLKSTNCKLEILRLSGCWLSNQSCFHLNTVLESDQCCLRELDVSHNLLKDSGVNLLKERLRDPICKLNTLKTEPSSSAPFLGRSSYFSSPLHSSTLFARARPPLLQMPKIRATGCPTEPLDRDYITEEPLNLSKFYDDPEVGDLGDCSFSFKNEHFVSKEGKELTVHLPHTKTNDGDSGGSGDDGKDISRAKTECFGGASAEKESLMSSSDISAVPKVLTPEYCPNDHRSSYRLTCSSQGMFQCRYTGLVFKMETAGEVEYRTEPWNHRQLANMGYVPAGPLFDIKCPQGTLSQLRFPHCEVFSGKGRKHLSVIHINDFDESEILEPHETTDSYVVLNISGCSKYGATKKQPKKKYSPIHGLVLLFLQQSTLNVLLLPKNVDISEVREKRRKMKEPEEEKYLETTSNCILVPEEKYCLSCDPKHDVHPEPFATFVDYDYKNYIPTFQVEFCELAKVLVILKEYDRDKLVWQSPIKLSALQTGTNQNDSYPSSPYTPPGQDFFLKHKADLETRLQILSPFLSKLQDMKVINNAERELLNSKTTDTEKNQALLTMLQKRGGKAQEFFYKVLREDDPLLVEDLEKPNEI